MVVRILGHYHPKGQTMNLYKVTLLSVDAFNRIEYVIYAVAIDSAEAEKASLNLMRNLKYMYDRAFKVELLASVNTYKADHLLVIV